MLKNDYFDAGLNIQQPWLALNCLSLILQDYSKCCGYGSTGKKTTKGYDCVVLPGASAGAIAQTRLVSSRACGNAFGSKSTKVPTAAAGGAWTVCSKYNL